MKLRVLNHIHKLLFADYIDAQAEFEKAESELSEKCRAYDTAASAANLRMLHVPSPDMLKLKDEADEIRARRNEAKEWLETSDEALKAFADAEWTEVPHA